MSRGGKNEIDARIIEDFRQRRGRIIDSQEQVGGYPCHGMTRLILEVPDTNRQEWLGNPAAEVEG